jgi:hypothetical protein
VSSANEELFAIIAKKESTRRRQPSVFAITGAVIVAAALICGTMTGFETRPSVESSVTQEPE